MRKITSPLDGFVSPFGAMRGAQIITAITQPALGPLFDGDVISTALSADIATTSNYASTAGEIVSVDLVVTVNGDAATISDTVNYEDVVSITVTVTDDASNVRVWTLGTVVTAEAPSPFEVADWGLSNSDGDVSLNVLSLPSDGGAPIADIEYRVNSGDAVSTGETTTGSYLIAADEGDDVEIRAINAIGAADWSDTKVVPAPSAGTAPDPFTSGDWSMTTLSEIAGDTVTLTISALPDDGGSSITDLEYRIGTGSAVSLSGTTTGNYTIAAVTADNVQIRAVNAIGESEWSDVKAAPVDPDLVLVFDTSFGPDLVARVNLRGDHDVTIDWGDGTSDSYSFTGTTVQERTRTYATGGIYTVRVSGTAVGFGTDSATNRTNLRRCLSFGTLGITNLQGAFRNRPNLIQVPTVLPVGVTAMNSMFSSATAFNQNIGSWDTSNVTNMAAMLNGATSFNQNIGAWNTSNVTSMSAMFFNATNFNQNIGAWDTSRVGIMDNMFQGATSFNQDISTWCVGNIASQPASFSTGSALISGNRPIWGTCPLKQAATTISFIGSATGTNSATVPAHNSGDILVVFAFRDGSTTAPTLPSGWTNINNAGANTSAQRNGFRISDGTITTTGTWTNATSVIVLVYRGVGQVSANATASTAASTTVNYPANGTWVGLSRLVAVAGHRSIDTALDTPPGSLTLRANVLDATDHAVAFDSNNSNEPAWASTDVSVGGTSDGWHSTVLRLVPVLEDIP
jgi:surface protein